MKHLGFDEHRYRQILWFRDTEACCEKLENDHSFSTAFPSIPTVTNRAITPST